MIIGVAPSPADRIRLTELVGGSAPLLLVSSTDEATAFLHRTASPKKARVDGPTEVDLGDLRIDSDRQVVCWSGREVSLTPLEHNLLTCLMSEPGRTWTFESLYETVWDARYLGNRYELHSLVKRLRRKMNALETPFAIEAIRGVGFRLGDRGEADTSQIRVEPDIEMSDAVLAE